MKISKTKMFTTLSCINATTLALHSLVTNTVSCAPSPLPKHKVCLEKSIPHFVVLTRIFGCRVCLWPVTIQRKGQEVRHVTLDDLWRSRKQSICPSVRRNKYFLVKMYVCPRGKNFPADWNACRFLLMDKELYRSRTTEALNQVLIQF